MEGKVLKIVLLLVALFVVFSVIVPYLVSAASNLLVIGGVLVGAITLYLAYKFLKNILE